METWVDAKWSEFGSCITSARRCSPATIWLTAWSSVALMRSTSFPLHTPSDNRTRPDTNRNETERLLERGQLSPARPHAL